MAKKRLSSAEVREFLDSLKLPEESSGPTEVKLTGAAVRFVHEDRNLMHFLTFMLRLVKTPYSAEEVSAVYERLKAGDFDVEKITNIVNSFGEHTTMLRYGGLVAQMQHTRMVDNFLCYISELLALIFRARPETMRSDETTIQLSQVLQYKTMDELVSALADKRVTDLAYLGLHDLAKFLSKRIGLDLFPTPTTMKIAVELIEERNLIVHNRGIVNQIFVSRLPEYADELGKPLELSVTDNSVSSMFLNISALDIDARARKKFDLPTTTVSLKDRPKDIPGEW